MTIQDTSSLPSGQKEPDHPQTLRVRRNDKVTEEYNEPDGTLTKRIYEHQPRKTLWDLLQLLIIPFVLLGIGSWFSYQQSQTSIQVSQAQHQSDQKIALDQQHATTLQTYIDNIQVLLLNHNLLQSSSTDPNNPYYDVALLAQARTLTAIQGLDPQRKGVLLTFLYQAKLIGFIDITAPATSPGSKASDPIIRLNNADLSGAELPKAQLPAVYFLLANLSGAVLTGAYLEVARLSGANLSGANLSGADLINSSLDAANLSGADLSGAGLLNADLTNAHLNGANIARADLLDAKITQKQLDQVASCKNAILPQGLICHH